MVSVTQFISMNPEPFFEKLSPKGAHVFLQRFLEVESLHIKETAKRCAADGVKMDFSLKSIPPFMRWICAKLKTIQKEPDPSVPKWLRSNEVYAKNLFDFDEASGILVMRAGYYLGESFVRSFRSLRWGTGDVRTADANMPVVAGFKHELEMPPIIVADNLLARLVVDPKTPRGAKKCVESWTNNVLAS